MSKNLVYISDFFVEHVLGGGELNDHELIQMLQQEEKSVEKIQSHLADTEYLERQKDTFFLISNFCNLKQSSKDWLIDNGDYLIYEHDHKYLVSRNPADYRDFKAPISDIRNYSFYKNAIKIICQSKFHEDIVQKNLNLDNILNVGGNLWSIEALNKLRQFNKKEKQQKCSILNSSITHKNTHGASLYCKKNNLEYDLISSSSHIDFLDQISNNRIFVFLPKTPETLSRVVVEARMMGMSVRTNGLVGASHEPWFELKGDALVNRMLSLRKEILDAVLNTTQTTREKNHKEISIISTFHDGEEFLSGFLQNIVEQTVFDKCELILIDSVSKNREKEIVKEYVNRYDNIFYYRIEDLLHPTPCLNLAIQKSTGKYITFGLIDDRKKKNCLETLLNGIQEHNVDLVYGNVAQTSTKNQKFEENDLKTLFEHSKYDFSKENMVKCLPGPMPLWKRSIHEKCGFFDENKLNYADDWDMWLRSVSHGCKFKKIDDIVGIYLKGGRSQQNSIKQRQEEAKLFFKYGHMFGKNYDLYKSYFQQFV